MGPLLTFNEAHRTRKPQSHWGKPCPTAVSPPSNHPTSILVTGLCLLRRASGGNYLGQKSGELAPC